LLKYLQADSKHKETLRQENEQIRCYETHINATAGCRDELEFIVKLQVNGGTKSMVEGVSDTPVKKGSEQEGPSDRVN
jgi:hypothetical protein